MRKLVVDFTPFYIILHLALGAMLNYDNDDISETVLVRAEMQDSSFLHVYQDIDLLCNDGVCVTYPKLVAGTDQVSYNID